MFLTLVKWKEAKRVLIRRNPLKSGQCFLQQALNFLLALLKKPRSQSPQIGSMFLTSMFLTQIVSRITPRRNPLKSGQCFLPVHAAQMEGGRLGRNPLKSGQCFLLIANAQMGQIQQVAIPSNRVNVSYKEYGVGLRTI